MWNMQDELTFIDHIGTWSREGGKKQLTVGEKLWLLKGYREGLSRRKSWTNLNPTELQQYVDKQIEQLKKLAPDAIL